MQTDQRYTRKKGFYHKDDKKYISVTTALSVLNKPGLTIWLQKQAFEAAKGGVETFAEATKLVNNKSTEVMDLGTQVHKYIECYWSDEKVVITPEMKPFIDAFHEWIIENKPKVIHNEITIHNDEFLYAGTIDLIVEIEGKKCLVDIKTGKDVYSTVELQSTAYKMAYDSLYPDSKIDETYVLLLKKNRSGGGTGEYEFKKLDYVPKVWESVMRLFFWEKGFR